MRCLVTYNADRLADLSADLAPEEAEAAGLGGVDAPLVLTWCDPIADARDRPDGEDERGLPLYQHPEMMLLEDADLWTVVDRWRCGVAREFSRDDYAAISNWEAEAWLTMRAAHGREERREIERLKTRASDG